MGDHERLALRYTELMYKCLAGRVGMQDDSIAMSRDPPVESPPDGTKHGGFAGQLVHSHYDRGVRLTAQYFKQPHKPERASPVCRNGKLHMYGVWLPELYRILERIKTAARQTDCAENFGRRTLRGPRSYYHDLMAKIPHAVRYHPRIGPNAILCWGIRAYVEYPHFRRVLTASSTASILRLVFDNIHQ